jgi:hypothetical protein
MARKAEQEQDDTTTAAPWSPPKGSQPVELAEFYKFAAKGETVIGRIQRVTARPDPNHPDKLMRGLVMSPVVVINTKGQRAAFRTLAIGLSAHLGLLIDQPEKKTGAAYAFQYDGTRPGEKGKNPSHQFNVFALSEQQFASEVRATDAEHAELLLSSGTVGEQDDLPF